MLNWTNKSFPNRIKNTHFEISECFNPLFIGSYGKLKKSKINNVRVQKFNIFTDKNNFPKEIDINSIFTGLKNNLLFDGDNLSVLNYLFQNLGESVDLIYIDPPFMTNLNFYKTISLNNEDNTVDLNGKENGVSFQQHQYNDKWILDEYLQFLYERIVLFHKLLKKTGSIYIHLDENCSHYIKVIMDEVFGRENFRREIIWNTASLNVAGFKGRVRNNWIYGAGHILFYTKSDSYTFNTQFIPRSQEFIDKKYKKSDEDGLYRITRRDNKIYLKDDKGEPIINIWNDILSFNYAKIASKESVFYPTQKPEKLLKRIIMASSNPGDVVLDSFCGSGTTLAVAQKLGRKWIGCDSNPISIFTTSKRLQRIIYNQNSIINSTIETNSDINGSTVLNSDIVLESIENSVDFTVRYMIFKESDNFLDKIHDKEEIEDFYSFSVDKFDNTLNISIDFLEQNEKFRDLINSFLKNENDAIKFNYTKNTSKKIKEIIPESFIRAIYIQFQFDNIKNTTQDTLNPTWFANHFSDIPNGKKQKVDYNYKFSFSDEEMDKIRGIKVRFWNIFGSYFDKEVMI